MASTFEGFCDAHDGTLFAPVETSPRLIDRTALYLFSFRALAYSRHRKAVALERVNICRELDAGLAAWAQASFQRRVFAMQAGTTRAMTDLTAMKDRLDHMYRFGDYSGFNAAGWLFSEFLPVAYSGAFYPEYDLNRTPLQRLGHGDDPFEIVCATLTPWNGKALLVLAWVGEQDGPAERYVRSFHALPDDKKAGAAVYAGFNEQENIIMRPSWWNNLPQSYRDALEEMRMSGTETVPGKLSSECNFTIASSVVESTYYFGDLNFE
ncbi:hypothetical protein [Stenotrophomonas sp.]|uniref:hypothetical protein n=1 Tax=Stenotrophomonas sp. TaxID=69392 RepID=UPI0028AC2F2F|nr:hypothetical protein [Stenotrophomonas sp.]